MTDSRGAARWQDPAAEGANDGAAQPAGAGAWLDLGDATPFVFLQRRDAGWQMRGQARKVAGHRLAGPAGGPPRGLFGEWSWDGETLTARTDPLGFFSLFVYEKDGEIGISPSILQLIAQGADPAPDPLAQAVYHRLGFFLGEDTPFRHIRILPPQGALTWRGGRLNITGGIPAGRTTPLPRDAAIEAFIELPRAEIRHGLRHWDGPVTLPLSGGRDSRHILLEMVHQGRKPDACVTFHSDGAHLNAEARSARAIADHVGVRHLMLGHRRTRLRDSVRALLMGQLCTDEHGQMLPLYDYFAGRGHAAFDGIAGDVLTKSRGVIHEGGDGGRFDLANLRRPADFQGLARSIIADHARIIGRPGRPGGAGAIHSPDLDAAATDRVAQALMQVADYPNPYRAFIFWHRTRREISFVTTAILGSTALTLAPYLAPEMVELGLSLPPHEGFANLNDMAIRRAYPDAAGIPYDDDLTVPPPPPMRAAKIRSALDSLRIAAMAGPGTLPASVLPLFRDSALHRQKADIYRLQDGFVSAMSAAEARRLLDLGRRLSAAAPKGDATVSDDFPGR